MLLRKRALLLMLLLSLSALLFACAPEAYMLNDPAYVPQSSAASGTTSTPTAQADVGAGAYTDAVADWSDSRVLAISLTDYAEAFNRHANSLGFTPRLPAELGIGNKKTVEYAFSEAITLSFSLSGGWIDEIVFEGKLATADDFDLLRAGGAATLLAADPMLLDRDVAMLLDELGLGEEADDTEGSLSYDRLAFSWEITDENSIVFTVVPDPDEPSATP